MNKINYLADCVFLKWLIGESIRMGVFTLDSTFEIISVVFGLTGNGMASKVCFISLKRVIKL